MEQTFKKTILEIEDIQNIQPDFEQLKILDQETAQKIQVLIFAKERNVLKVLTTNNYSKSLNKIMWVLEEKWYKHEIYYTSLEGFLYALGRYEQLQDTINKQQIQIKEQKQAEWKSAIQMIKKIFETKDSVEPWEFITEVIRLAFQTWASDLHFQVEIDKVESLIRIDGVLQKILEFDIDDFQKYLQKIMFISWAKLNIDYIPQDWRFTFEAVDINWKTRNIDARVSLIPWLKIPSTVIRFLDSTTWLKWFEEIWFNWKSYEILKRNILKNTGVTIFTWPTGSWKSTTLYSILNYLNDWSKKIITLEDPIEYQLLWIQQSQINPNKWYTYEVWLKAVLRHDPDVILIWEIRSKETAEIWINAALTWHLVFTTLHTNSAIEWISRLMNMWVKAYMIAPAVNLIIWQRLVRKICPYCSTKIEASYAEKEEILEQVKIINEVDPKMNLHFDWTILHAAWCEKCNNTWYLWRTSIVETFEVSDSIKKLIVEWTSTMDIYSTARSNGYFTLKEDWIIKVLNWETTLDELRRVL